MLVFRSEDHIDRWCAARALPRGATMTLAQCGALARGWYADKLDAAWRRKTRDEAEALFASIGLVGPFWRLGA
ncbi:MAG TPA: hypothetical protein VFQ53_29290 [Kofleriaceae bacterium]|nr:hypothetical protein [Kofleriaceae bacterium]